MRRFSIANIILLACAVKLSIDIYIRKKIIAMPASASGSKTPDAAEIKLLPAEEIEKPLLSKKDFLILGILTSVYAAVALYNLGSFKAPQSYWKPANKGESFYIDAGKSRNIDRVSYFLSFGAGSYLIDFSDDGQVWRDEKRIEQKNIYEPIEWRYFNFGGSARYVRITAEKPGAMLNEIGLFATGTATPIPVKAISAIKILPISPEYGKPENVFDEPATVAYVPSFINGMYFDEIYHSRTAYEYLHHLPPTEPTHPPLGKVIISAGVAAFGMTPFGWRIMGVLFGIAMIPAIYCFAKHLFRKSGYAFVAAFLFAFDFMHFTYTRIGVIDCFAVFFIILIYYYMYRYFMMNFFEERLWRTFVPLLLSGVFFGLGAATKWIAVFCGAGLAMILFISLGRRFYEYLKARIILELQKNGTAVGSIAENQAIVRTFFPKLIFTLMWCILAFVVIPAAIYMLSYLPFMMTDAPGYGLADVFRLQNYMYKYHHTMQITHPFSSVWWEWPIIKKPLWLYMGKDVPAGQISSIVAMGNPAIWWAGVPAIIAVAGIALCRKDKGMLVVLLAASSQYVPWMIRPTDLTFIFHFFATTPFMILCLTYVFKVISDKLPKFKYAVFGYLLLVLFLFFMFYPILSGAIVSKSFVATYLRWFNSWIFYV